MSRVPLNPVPVQTAHGSVYLWLITQAEAIRASGHPWSVFLAGQIDDLARNQNFVQACTPEDMVDRLNTLEQEYTYEVMASDGPEVEF
jgi:hypothetical protein